MRYHKLSVTSILAIVFIGGLATSIPSPWGEMLEKHKWVHIPDNWDTVGHPPDGTTIDLHIALKPERKNALVDALLEVSQPRHPKFVLLTIPLFGSEAHSSCFFVSDMAHISQRNRSLSLSLHTPIHSSLSAPG